MIHSHFVYSLLKKHFGKNEIIGIEIGTGNAEMTVKLLDLPNLKKLYTIDSWEHRDEEIESSDYKHPIYHHTRPQSYHDYAKKQALNRLKKFGKRIVIIHLRSENALSKAPRKVDFVWIDGDHSEKGIKNDIINYEPLVKKGGILGGHDYGNGYPVTDIVRNRYKQRLNLGDDHTWWIKI